MHAQSVERLLLGQMIAGDTRRSTQSVGMEPDLDIVFLFTS